MGEEERLRVCVSVSVSESEGEKFVCGLEGKRLRGCGGESLRAETEAGARERGIRL